MKNILIVVAWVVSLGMAFFVGQTLSTSAPEEEPAGVPPEEVAQLESRIDQLREQVAEERSRSRRARARAKDAEASEFGGVDEPVAAEDSRSPAAAPGDVPASFSLEGMTDPAEASALFMAFVDGQLGRGKEGHEAILRAMCNIWENREMLEALFGDESTAVRELYPWVKFLVKREDEVVAMSDYVFKTMAEDPQSLAYVPDDNVLEIFTEGMGILLPGAVSEERLSVFRGYAQKIIETPEDQQPKPVAQNRREIERLLTQFWLAPMSAEEALALLQAGNVPTNELVRLLRRVPPEQLKPLDVTGLILPLIKQGNNDLVRFLRVLPEGTLDIIRVDEALLDGMRNSKVQSWFASRVFGATGRESFEDLRTFVERAFDLGDPAATAAGQMLTQLPSNLRPDKSYVEGLVARNVLSKQVTQQLKQAYAIKVE